MAEKEPVVEGGEIEMGAGTGKTDPLNPNTLEEKIGHQDEQSPSPEEITEEAIKGLSELYSKDLVIKKTREVKEKRRFSSTIRKIRTIDTDNRFIGGETAGLELSYFVKHRGIMLIRHAYTESARYYLIEVERNELSYDPKHYSTWQELNHENFLGAYLVQVSITKDAEKFGKIIHDIHNRYNPRERSDNSLEIQEVINTCKTGTGDMNHERLKHFLPDYVSKVLSLQGTQFLVGTNPYLLAACAPEKFAPFFANAISEHEKCPVHGQRNLNGVAGEDLSWNVLSQFGIVQRHEKTNSSLDIVELLDAYNTTLGHKKPPK